MSISIPFSVSGAKSRKAARTPEEQDIIRSLGEIRNNMNSVYDRLNYSSDELITDSLNYELLALRSRHRFYIQKAKELRLRGI